MTDKLDEYKKRRELFLQEWQVGVAPIDEHFRLHNQDAVQFAQSAIKAAFLLNGGGLVAIPVAMQIFDINARLNVTGITGSSAFYILGLVAAWLTTAAAYFTTVNFGYAAVQRREAAAFRLHDAYLNQQTNRADECDEKAEEHVRRGNILRYIAIGLSFLSFFAFVAATLWGAHVLLYPKA